MKYLKTLSAASAFVMITAVSALAQDTLIPLVDGMTCYQDRCFNYNPKHRSARRPGFGSVRIPPELEAKPGYITLDVFVAVERAINKQTGLNGR